jgi:hypothetical protein
MSFRQKIALTKAVIIVLAVPLVARLVKVLRSVQARINKAPPADRMPLTVKFVGCTLVSVLPTAAAFYAIYVTSPPNAPAGWRGLAEIGGAILLVPILLPVVLNRAALVPAPAQEPAGGV